MFQESHNQKNLHEDIVDADNSHKREVLGLGMLDVAGDVRSRARRAEGSGHADDDSVTVNIHLVSEVDLVAGVTLLQNIHVGKDIADLDEGCGRRVEGATGDRCANDGRRSGSEPGQRTEGGAERHLAMMCCDICTRELGYKGELFSQGCVMRCCCEWMRLKVMSLLV